MSRTVSWLVVLFHFLALPLIFNSVSAADQISSSGSFTTILFSLINQYRHQNSLPPLASSPFLTSIATSRAADLNYTNEFTHFPSSTPSYQQYATTLNLDYLVLGENLSFGYSHPQDVLTAWIKSPSHRQLLLHSRFTHLGLASSGSSPYVVAIFSASH